MAALQAAKQVLRKQMKDSIGSLSKDEKLRQSLHVVKKFLASKEYAECRRISVFLSMHDEIQTHEILKDVFATNRQCFIPRYTMETMDMVRLHSMEDYDSLPETKWKIKQPLIEEPREEALQGGGLDILLVPGLAFSHNGERCGRGRGYYDNYIARLCDETAQRPRLIALAFKEQVLDQVPMSERDMRIDRVIYEQG